MNEKEIIAQLKKAQKIGPTLATQEQIAAKIFGASKSADARQERQHSGFLSWVFSTKIGFGTAFAFVFVLILAGTLMLNNHLLYAVRIALAPNSYEKAKLALSEANESLKDAQSSSPSYKDEKLLTEVITAQETNTYFDNLNLIGEPGKYTGEQCHVLYKQYEAYLADFDKTATNAEHSANTQDQKNLEKVRLQLTELGKQADKRWQK